MITQYVELRVDRRQVGRSRYQAEARCPKCHRSFNTKHLNNRQGFNTAQAATQAVVSEHKGECPFRNQCVYYAREAPEGLSLRVEYLGKQYECWLQDGIVCSPVCEVAKGEVTTTYVQVVNDGGCTAVQAFKFVRKLARKGYKTKRLQRNVKEADYCEVWTPALERKQQELEREERKKKREEVRRAKEEARRKKAAAKKKPKSRKVKS